MSKKTPLSQGFIARVAAGVRYAFTGNADGWFDAGEPLAPVAQQAEGRRFDYEPFYNVGHSKPREREAIGFAQLRDLADNYDVLRLVIEKRKDQMECLKWTIQKRDIESTANNESQRKDRKVDEAIAFFSRLTKSIHGRTGCASCWKTCSSLMRHVSIHGKHWAATCTPLK